MQRGNRIPKALSENNLLGSGNKTFNSPKSERCMYTGPRVTVIIMQSIVTTGRGAVTGPQSGRRMAGAREARVVCYAHYCRQLHSQWCVGTSGITDITNATTGLNSFKWDKQIHKYLVMPTFYIVIALMLEVCFPPKLRAAGKYWEPTASVSAPHGPLVPVACTTSAAPVGETESLSAPHMRGQNTSEVQLLRQAVTFIEPEWWQQCFFDGTLIAVFH